MLDYDDDLYSWELPMLNGLREYPNRTVVHEQQRLSVRYSTITYSDPTRTLPID
jgi:hypothetical protein